MRELIPHKIIIEFEEGNFKDGVFLYRVKDNGVLQKGYKSIAIKNMDFSKPQLNDILKKIKDHTKTVEELP